MTLPGQQQPIQVKNDNSTLTYQVKKQQQYPDISGQKITY